MLSTVVVAMGARGRGLWVEPPRVAEISDLMSMTRPPLTTEGGRRARNCSADSLGPGARDRVRDKIERGRNLGGQRS